MSQRHNATGFTHNGRPIRYFCSAQGTQEDRRLQSLEELAGPYFEYLSRQQMLDLRAVLSVWACFEEEGDPQVSDCAEAAWKLGLLQAEHLLSKIFGLCSELSPATRDSLLTAVQNALDSCSLHRRGGGQ